MRVTRDDKSLIRLAKRWLSQQVSRVRAALAPRMFLLGFAEFQVVVAGSRLGLFELLATRPGRTAEEIRDQLRIPDHSARALLLACTSLGFVKRNPRRGTYRNARKIQRLFVGPERAWVIPHLEAFHFLMYQPFYHLTGALQQGTNVGLQCLPGNGSTLYDRLESSSENKRIFYAWMKSLKQGSVPAEVVAGLRGCRQVLDVGPCHTANLCRTLRQDMAPHVVCGRRARLGRARMTLRSGWSGMPEKMRLVCVTVERDIASGRNH